MAKIKIDRQRCKGCYLCIVNCPKTLIKISSDMNVKGIKPAIFLGGKCTGCGMCAVICPDGGIRLIK
jgi:2-oxoglutarate ferredoxin oxidoreductase subunit delta